MGQSCPAKDHTLSEGSSCVVCKAQQRTGLSQLAGFQRVACHGLSGVYSGRNLPSPGLGPGS